MHDKSLCLEAKCFYDCWMLGATIYELLTGCRLFNSERVDSDAINPACLHDLINWSGLETHHQKQVLSNCSAPSAELEKANALDLLERLLASNEAARPTMGDVLVHPFWKPAGDMGMLPNGEHRKLVLGRALSTLETHTANYCTTAATQFLQRCRASVQSGQTWRGAVESHVVKKSRKPKLTKHKPGGRWGDVNGNLTRKPPMQCAKCQTVVEFHFQPGEHVLFHLRQVGWTDGFVQCIKTCNSDEYLIGAQIHGEDKVLTRSSTELCSTKGTLHKECRHVAEGGTLEEISITEEDYYDFELRTIWDVTKLFVQYGHKDFKEDFRKHDGTNLFNLLACIGADEGIVDLADKAKNARNEISHDGSRMNLSQFKSAIQNMQNLANETGGTNTAEWVKLDNMIKAVEARGD